MSETKQDVFEALMTDMAHGSEQWRIRYAAASDGDPECPWCHAPSGREVTKQEYINDYMTDEATGDPIDTLDIGMLIGITCCQWCGRALRGEPDE